MSTEKALFPLALAHLRHELRSAMGPQTVGGGGAGGGGEFVDPFHHQRSEDFHRLPAVQNVIFGGNATGQVGTLNPAA